MKKIYIVIFLLFTSSSWSAEIELATNQAIVFAGVDRHSFQFEEVSTGDTFTIKGGKKYRYKHFVVKSGKYYLKSIDVVVSGMSKYEIPKIDRINFDKPEDIALSFNIKEGSVTYLGDWIIDMAQKRLSDLSWKVHRDYSYEHIKKIRKRNPNLASFPLIIANEEGKALSVAWDEI